MRPLHYPFDPAPIGTRIPIREQITRLKLPLPFALDHVNVWQIGGREATLVDCGFPTPTARRIWDTHWNLMARRGTRLDRIVITHMHPDHVGLAGDFARRHAVPLHMTGPEWQGVQRLCAPVSELRRAEMQAFYGAAGLPASTVAEFLDRAVQVAESVTPIADDPTPLFDLDRIRMGGTGWQVILGKGHSPAPASLYSADLRVLIAGDQILPRITPNLSVWSSEPDANPIADYLASLDGFKDLPDDTLVLPSHGEPFEGLHARIADLHGHHEARLEETADCCREPCSAAEIMARLFRRELDSHQVMFAIGETLAHLNFLVKKNHIICWKQSGINLYHLV